MQARRRAWLEGVLPDVDRHAQVRRGVNEQRALEPVAQDRLPLLGGELFFPAGGVAVFDLAVPFAAVGPGAATPRNFRRPSD